MLLLYSPSHSPDKLFYRLSPIVDGTADSVAILRIRRYQNNFSNVLIFKAWDLLESMLEVHQPMSATGKTLSQLLIPGLQTLNFHNFQISIH